MSPPSSGPFSYYPSALHLNIKGRTYEVHDTLNTMLESPVRGLIDMGPGLVSVSHVLFAEW